MAKVNRPAREYLASQIRGGQSAGHQAQREMLFGAQSITANDQTVTGTSGSWWAFAYNASTTLAASAAAGDTTLSVASAAGISSGSVITIGAIQGTAPAPQVQWVTAVSGTTLTITPGLYSAASSGAVWK